MEIKMGKKIKCSKCNRAELLPVRGKDWAGYDFQHEDVFFKIWLCDFCQDSDLLTQVLLMGKRKLTDFLELFDEEK